MIIWKGTARLIFCPLSKPAVFSPTNLPNMSNNAPPELPLEIGAVNCIIFIPLISLKPETMPSEMELNRPKGLPKPVYELVFIINNYDIIEF